MGIPLKGTLITTANYYTTKTSSCKHLFSTFYYKKGGNVFAYTNIYSLFRLQFGTGGVFFYITCFYFVDYVRVYAHSIVQNARNIAN